MEIYEKDALRAWEVSLGKVWQEGRIFKDQEGRVCKEVLNLVVCVEDPCKDIGEPARWLAHQEEWVYPSLDQISKVILSDAGSLFFQYAYGERVFKFQGKKNQLEDFVLPLLSKSSESRRALISLYDPIKDSDTSKEDVPCLVSIQFRVMDKKVHVTGHIRSNDLFIGWPANAYQLFVLQSYTAAKLGLEIGSLTTISGSAHIFIEYEEELKRLINEV
ncbi:MAG: thymidylate synthase [Nanoarchaeota archaeon]